MIVFTKEEWDAIPLEKQEHIRDLVKKMYGEEITDVNDKDEGE